MKVLRKIWVGYVVLVVASIRKDDVGLAGPILQDRRHTFVVLTPKGVKHIRKDDSWFCLHNGRYWFRVWGNDILLPGPDRVKSKRRFIKVERCDPPYYNGPQLDPDVR